jgi:hypothetical protein
MMFEFLWDESTKKYRRDTSGWKGSLTYPNPPGPNDPDPTVAERRAQHIFYFIPRPSSIRKNLNMNWRVSHSGTQQLKKARFRGRESNEYRLSGSFSEDLRFEFEYYLKQESKFLIRNHQMQNPDATLEDWNGTTDEEDFVIIKSANFSGSEGAMFMKDYGSEDVRALRVNYEIILERVKRDDVYWT